MALKLSDFNIAILENFIPNLLALASLNPKDLNNFESNS